jgi:hypothetical protein
LHQRVPRARLTVLELFMVCRLFPAERITDINTAD